jgi:DNA-binding NtrC family response regulator
MNHILLVDDEANILASLKRELMAQKGEFSIETRTSPTEALKLAHEKAFDLVISDYKMPEMDGVAFLQAFREIQPDAARIILSGQTDQHALVDAINRTHIYRFIGKPWNELELAGAVSQALALHEAARRNRWLAGEYRVKYGHPAKSEEAEKRHQILVVDDEQNTLNAVVRDLARHSPFQGLCAALRREASHERAHEPDLHFIVETAVSPLAALQRAQEVDYELVIADFLMPEMNGLDFLEAFRKIRPDAARILFSGHADMKILSDAINSSEIYAFIAKPWSEYDLRSAVTQAIIHRDLLLENQRLASELKLPEMRVTPQESGKG